MDLKEIVAEVPTGVIIAWGVCVTLSGTVSVLIVWALVKYISSP